MSVRSEARREFRRQMRHLIHVMRENSCHRKMRHCMSAALETPGPVEIDPEEFDAANRLPRRKDQ